MRLQKFFAISLRGGGVSLAIDATDFGLTSAKLKHIERAGATLANDGRATSAETDTVGASAAGDCILRSAITFHEAQP